MGQVEGLEPSSSAWKAEVLTIYTIPAYLESDIGFEPMYIGLQPTTSPLGQSLLAHPEGFEPSTKNLEDFCSSPD